MIIKRGLAKKEKGNKHEEEFPFLQCRHINTRNEDTCDKTNKQKKQAPYVNVGDVVGDGLKDVTTRGCWRAGLRGEKNDE